MSRMMLILMLATSMPLTLAAETGTPIRVWIMPTSARHKELSGTELSDAVKTLRNGWGDLLDLGESEYSTWLREKPPMLFDLLGQTNVLQDIREAFKDEQRGTGILEDGVWYPINVRLSEWEWNLWQQQIKEAEKSGRPPDLMEIGTTWVPYLADNGTIIAVPESTATNRYHHGLLQALSYRDQLLAYPRQIEIRVLFSNTDKVGRFSEQPTWRGLHAVLGQDKQFSMPKVDQNAFHTFAALAYARGIKLFHVEGDYLKPAEPGALNEGFKFFKDLGDGFRFLDSRESVGCLFARGEVAATVGGADYFLHLRNENRDDAWQEWAQVHPLPPCQDGLSHVWLGGSGLAIGKWYGAKCSSVPEDRRRLRAIELVAERFTRTAPLAMHVACPADYASRTNRFAEFGSPGHAYLAIVDTREPSMRFVSYPPHPALVQYENGPKNHMLIRAIASALRGDPRAARRLHARWAPVREALMTREGAILGVALLLILVLLLGLIGMESRRARTLADDKEEREAVIAAVLSRYVVAIDGNDSASIRGRGRPAPIGYGTLVECDGRTCLLTTAHVLEKIDLEKTGMTIRTLDAPAVVISISNATQEKLPSHSFESLLRVNSDDLRERPGIAMMTDRVVSRNQVHAVTLRNERLVVFHGHMLKNEGRWQERPDKIELPRPGDSGIGLFVLVPTEAFPFLLAGVFSASDSHPQTKNRFYFGTPTRLARHTG